MISMCKRPSLLDQWRERLGGRHRRVQPRPLAAMGYLADGPVIDGLIAIEDLILALLYDQPIRPGQCAYGWPVTLAAVFLGARFGGRANCRFTKDLLLQPVPGGEGYRMDLADENLLAVGLQLDRELDRHVRVHKRLRDRPSLPKLWAGFRPEIAANITGDGPELATYAAHIGADPECLLERLRRDCQGFTLFPLSWVSHHWQQTVAIFADLSHFPRRQVFRLHERDDLAGFHDAAEFDFLGRSGVKRPGLRRRQPALAAA